MITKLEHKSTTILRTVIVLLTFVIGVVLSDCSDGCSSCHELTCMSCESSYYLSNGFCKYCRDECTSCNSYDNCTSCKPKKYGLNKSCSLNCVGNCINGECQDETGYCIKCNPGFYGSKCQRNCSLCANEQCDFRKCSQGCRDGYYEYTAGSETFCQQCPSNCRRCNDGNTCYECNDGFYLYKYNNKVHCLSCSLGSQCSDYCVIQGCNECEIVSINLICKECPEGQQHNGVDCEPTTSPCSQECSTLCDNIGICQGECNNGWSGDKCLEKCHDNCLKCSKENSKVCHQCQLDFYSTDCSLGCSPSCLVEESKQTCQLTDGYCLNGCRENSWGETCNKTCPDGCKDDVCDRYTGQCERVCKDGSTAEECIPTTTIGRKDMPFSTTSSTTKYITKLSTSARFRGKDNNFIIGYFSGIGTAAGILIIAVMVYFIRKMYVARNLSRDNSRHIEIPTYYNTTTNREAVNVDPTIMDTNYESLGSNRVNEKEYSGNMLTNILDHSIDNGSYE